MPKHIKINMDCGNYRVRQGDAAPAPQPVTATLLDEPVVSASMKTKEGQHGDVLKDQ